MRITISGEQEVAGGTERIYKPYSWTSLKLAMKSSMLLNTLRGCAIALILLNHIVPISKDNPNPATQVFWNILIYFIKGGWIGEDLFFLLSGFMIFGVLFNEYKNIGFNNSPKLDIEREPNLYAGGFLFLAFIYIFDHVFTTYNLPLYHQLSWYVKGAQAVNYPIANPLQNSWAPDMEEFVYIGITAFFLIMAKTSGVNRKMLSRVYIGLLTLCTLGRMIPAIRVEESGFFYFYSHTRIDSLFLGVLIAYVHRFERHRLAFLVNNPIPVAAICIGLLLPNFIIWHANPVINIFTHSINPIALGGLVVLALNSNKRWLYHPLISYIGRHCYAIYLCHIFINNYIIANYYYQVTESVGIWIAYVITYLVLTIVIGVVVTKIVQKPFFALRDRFLPHLSNSPFV